MTDTTPAIGISLSVAPSDGRNVVLQAHVGRDEDQVVINGVIDKMYSAAERLVNRAAAQSLAIIMEKLQDDFDDQSIAYLTSVKEVEGKEVTLQSLLPGERDRDNRDDKRSRERIAAEINAAREQHATYLTNKIAHERSIERLKVKQAVHLELAK